MTSITTSYIVYFEAETNGWVSLCLETNVASQGESKDEAITNLREALELYFEDATPPVRRSIRDIGVGQLTFA